MTITTILLDLDDTLIHNSTDRFIPAYLKSLGNYLSDIAPAEEIISLVFHAIEEMQANQDVAVTNYDAFYRPFLQGLKLSYEQVHPRVTAFYRQVYPELRRFVTPVPQVRQFIADFFEAGYRICIATNPLFPATAIEQRLAWADALDFPYELITTMETMHFSKPNPRYYQEILARLDISAAEAIMVGDNPEHDIAPARQVGLATWRITAAADGAGNGSLAEFHDWLLHPHKP